MYTQSYNPDEGRTTQDAPQRIRQSLSGLECDPSFLGMTKRNTKNCSFENECLSPDRSGILFLASLARKRYKRIAGIAP